MSVSSRVEPYKGTHYTDNSNTAPSHGHTPEPPVTALQRRIESSNKGSMETCYWNVFLSFFVLTYWWVSYCVWGVISYSSKGQHKRLHIEDHVRSLCSGSFLTSAILGLLRKCSSVYSYLECFYCFHFYFIF